MQLKFQYNKISLKNMDKQLRVRQNALPILKSKESALRVYIQDLRITLHELEDAYNVHISMLETYSQLWNEFDFNLIEINEVELNSIKVAGISVSEVISVNFSVRPYCIAALPSWFGRGIEDLKQILIEGLKIEIERENLLALENARRKTTQKVNLYEKIHIPAYHDAILKINRYLENEEHIAMASQKILKNKLWNYDS